MNNLGNLWGAIVWDGLKIIYQQLGKKNVITK